MNPADFFNLSLSLQAALGAGYLGYCTAYAGLRRDHKTEDTLFITLAFSAIALIVFGLAQGRYGPLVALCSAFAASLLTAAIWRRWGCRWWLGLMKITRIHRDDGTHSTWSAIVQSSQACGQISVHMKNGTVLYLNDRRIANGAIWDGLYLGSDGAVVMAVEEEELPDGTTQLREDITDAGWGTRLTYIPAAEIARVNIRLK